MPVGGAEGAELGALLSGEGVEFVPVPIAGSVRVNVSLTEPDGTATKINSAGPELSAADLPFLFESNDHARGAMDGKFGELLARKIEERVDYRILGWFENGFRQVSNRLRPAHTPADLKGMRIRVLPSKIQARTFELLGAVPLMWDLTEAIEAIKAGTIDAQENPFANTVTYGVHKFHRFHTISNHFYISRPIFLHRPTFDAWPDDLKAAMQKAVNESVAFQRGLHVQEELDA